MVVGVIGRVGVLASLSLFLRLLAAVTVTVKVMMLEPLSNIMRNDRCRDPVNSPWPPLL